jgi:DNA primase
VVFDSDRAGKTAALKSLPIFLNEGLKARAVVLPEGHDPDSFVHSEGPDALMGLIEKAGSVFDFYVDLRLAEMDGSIEGKVDVIKEILPALSDLHHSSQQSLYVKRLSERLGIKEDIVWQELKRMIRKGPEATGKKELTSQLKEPRVKNTFNRDLHVLNLLIHHPEAAEQLRNASWQLLLTDASVIEIVHLFFRFCTAERSFKVEEMLAGLESEKAREKLREGMLMPSFYSEQTVDLAIRELEEKIRRIALSRSIREARQQGDIRDLNRLLKRKAEELS